MRGINKIFLFLLVGAVFVSCTKNSFLEEELSLVTKEQKSKPVNFRINGILNQSETTVATFGVYAYVKDTLTNSISAEISNETNWNIQLPLDESVKLFAFANVGTITESDSITTVKVEIDDFKTNEVYMSSLVQSVSDNSEPTVNFELNRMVGQVVFEPTEDETTLNNITEFDAIDVVFINIGSGYLPNENVSVQDTIAIRTTAANGFKAAAYSFPTFSGNAGTLEVVYYKDGQEVNKTKRALDVSILIEASKRSVVYMPLLDEDYLNTSFDPSAKLLQKRNGVMLKEFQF
ncbi:hypothetical protein [Wenyingzhuangia sp. IMCC45467]